LANLSTGKTANEVINYILHDPGPAVKLVACGLRLGLAPATLE